jgi:hypothetical protein
MTTMVTAFFDINREKKGDGRSIKEYLIWLKKTLRLNCNLFIVTEEKFKSFIEKNRSKRYKTYIKIDVLENAKFYKYRSQMVKILESEDYKKKISYPDRVECKLPEYNIIQYSKFGWLEDCIELNPFGSKYFFWMDAGISRFFLNVKLSNNYPGINGYNLIKKNKFIIQKRKDLETFVIDDNFFWGAENLLKGTMFGGNKEVVLKISNLVEEKFEFFLNKNMLNNEQLILTLVWKDNKDLFELTDDTGNTHLILFKKLS